MLSQILSISRVLTLALLLVTLTPAGWSQQTTVQSVLAPAVWSDTQIRATGVTWPVDCHSSSGVYFRQPSGGESWTFAPITALLRSGQSQVFDLRAATNYQQPVLGTTFYVNAQGTIYAAIQIGRETQWYIAQYDRAGTLSEGPRSRQGSCLRSCCRYQRIACSSGGLLLDHPAKRPSAQRSGRGTRPRGSPRSDRQFGPAGTSA